MHWLVLRVQFLDVKTTLDRWKEEVELIQVEIFRTAQYFRWMAYVWGHRGESSMIRGERAHAFSMRCLFTSLEKNIHDKIQ
jgi:hypothetical protein